MAVQEFRDALTFNKESQHKKLLSQMQSCDSCDADFTIEHALDCKSDSVVGHQHNDTWCNLWSCFSGMGKCCTWACDLCVQSASLDGTLVADLCMC